MIECGPYTLDYRAKTLIMGILNVTPDSFSDGGKHNHLDAALRHAEVMIHDGADILDIGGESTRPGHSVITPEQELERVAPIIERLSKEFAIPISIDTYKSEVAIGALEAGAHMINDVWGAKADPEMAAVAARFSVPIVIMHNRRQPIYDYFLRDILTDLYESIHIVKKAGVCDDKIILDPGIGFAKTHEENLLIMRNLAKLTDLGYPVLLGTSRKSMIGKALNLPVEERVEGTGASICFGIGQGCQIVRVHDVKEMARMAQMMDAMMGKGV